MATNFEHIGKKNENSARLHISINEKRKGKKGERTNEAHITEQRSNSETQPNGKLQ